MFSMGKSESFIRAEHLEEMSFPSAWTGGNHSMRSGASRCTGFHRTFSNMATCATRPIDLRTSLSQNHARYLSQENENHLLPKRRQVLSQIIPTCYNDGMVEWASVVWQTQVSSRRTLLCMASDLWTSLRLTGTHADGMLEVRLMTGRGEKYTLKSTSNCTGRGYICGPR